MKYLQMYGRLAVISMVACGHAAPEPTAPATRSTTLQLAVIPAESDAFPTAARAVSASLAAAHVAGAGEVRVSKVSLEVVQLSVECVEPTPTCYDAIGRSMSANRLLFARIDSAGEHQLKVTVTLYDVDGGAEVRTAAKLYANEAEATEQVAALIDKVAR